MATFEVKLTNVLGVGGFAQVLHATETSRGRAVAVKKSRVSLRVKRTILHYEARILQMVQSHPAITSLHGYGRFAHFEYLAIDLCGESVDTLAPRPHGTQLKTVIIIAQQMISALQHIHSRGIVHRDVKPDNILVSIQDPCRIMLVDFDISYVRNPGPTVHRYNPEAEHRNVIGTLNWASLNAHHGLDLSWRDDLESLACTLLFLLRANLPWIDASKHATMTGETIQVRILKTKWSGSTLANGYPVEFGRLLDETRALGFDDLPPYMRYLDMFSDLYSDSGFLDSYKVLDWSPAMRSDCLKTENSSNHESPNPPLVVGQLVSVQLLTAPTILGIVPGHELWGLEHTYDVPSTQALPAVILECTTDDGFQRVSLAAIKHGAASRFSRSIHITSSDGTDDVKTIPPWPHDDTYCYVFPDLRLSMFMPFVVAENTVQSINYRIPDQDMEKIRYELCGDESQPPELDDKEDDALWNVISQYNNFPVLARVAPLDPASKTVAWTSERAWFDEIVSISKHRAADNGRPWSTGTEDAGAKELSNSYWGSDYQKWPNWQQERDKALTFKGLPPSLLKAPLDVAIPRIAKIINTY